MQLQPGFSALVPDEPDLQPAAGQIIADHSCSSFVVPPPPPPTTTPPAGFPMHAKSTVNVGSGDPPRWSSKVNMALAVH